MSPGSSAESYPAFALNGLRENRVKTQASNSPKVPAFARIGLRKTRKNLNQEIPGFAADLTVHTCGLGCNLGLREKPQPGDRLAHETRWPGFESVGAKLLTYRWPSRASISTPQRLQSLSRLPDVSGRDIRDGVKEASAVTDLPTGDGRYRVRYFLVECHFLPNLLFLIPAKRNNLNWPAMEFELRASRMRFSNATALADSLGNVVLSKNMMFIEFRITSRYGYGVARLKEMDLLTCHTLVAIGVFSKPKLLVTLLQYENNRGMMFQQDVHHIIEEKKFLNNIRHQLLIENRYDVHEIPLHDKKNGDVVRVESLAQCFIIVLNATSIESDAIDSYKFL
ncbi:hypothetical protein ANN_12070 [Periplaneta americana]|uniref:Uncharacterized protein n=1 Tax=Periplaneta americana TaxID=6978 RepID=A0ABQ8T884_PERAM|nr:hypothetical protein ANN_12070 [Periplaneta americana]